MPGSRRFRAALDRLARSGHDGAMNESSASARWQKGRTLRVHPDLRAMLLVMAQSVGSSYDYIIQLGLRRLADANGLPLPEWELPPKGQPPGDARQNREPHPRVWARFNPRWGESLAPLMGAGVRGIQGVARAGLRELYMAGVREARPGHPPNVIPPPSELSREEIERASRVWGNMQPERVRRENEEG